MTFKTSPEIFRKFPKTKIAIILVQGIDNSADANPEILALLSNETKKIQETYSLETITQEPFIARWREIYRSFGAKPSDYRSSIENMLRMPLKGREIGHINTLTDLYNYISLHYKFPVGGENTDAMVGPLQLTFATANETPVQLLGDQKPESPFIGEVIYKDDAGTICRCWNWREGARTMLTKETKNAILVIEATTEEEYEPLQKAQNELKDLVIKYLKPTKIDCQFVDQITPIVTL